MLLLRERLKQLTEYLTKLKGWKMKMQRGDTIEYLNRNECKSKCKVLNKIGCEYIIDSQNRIITITKGEEDGSTISRSDKSV